MAQHNFNRPPFKHKTGPPNPENVPEDGKLKSEMMIKDNRRYYLDLKENTRGRFLRVRVFFFKLSAAPDSMMFELAIKLNSIRSN